jgi:simple sugar transport system ATP-binding protein
VGNSFTILSRGKSMGTYSKQKLSREKLLNMMAGGEELDKLEVELKEIDRIGKKNN